MRQISPRVITRLVWRQTRPRNALLDFESPAHYEGRYHEIGDTGVWYGSSTERGAWAELFRHWGEEGISPFEVRRRVGRAKVTDLAVLDLTDPQVRDRLGVTDEELVSDDLSRCQELATEAREAGFDGILAPSAALAGDITLGVFASAMGKVDAEHSRIQRPPIRMIRVLEQIRVPDAGIDTVGRLYEALVALRRRLRGR
jgi:RES domain-containing protein